METVLGSTARTTPASTPFGPHLPEPRDFVVFRLGGRQYGVDVRNVCELRHYDMLTRVADGPVLVEGVVISRGTVMPLIDLRAAFRCGAPLYDDLTMTMTLDIGGRKVCAVVDDVAGLVALPAEQVMRIRHTAPGVDPACVLGVAEYERRPLVVLDIEYLLAGVKRPPARKMVN